MACSIAVRLDLYPWMRKYRSVREYHNLNPHVVFKCWAIRFILLEKMS